MGSYNSPAGFWSPAPEDMHATRVHVAGSVHVALSALSSWYRQHGDVINYPDGSMADRLDPPTRRLPAGQPEGAGHVVRLIKVAMMVTVNK